MIMKIAPTSTKVIISCVRKRGIPFWVWRKVNGNWYKNMIMISQWRSSHCITNTSVRKKKEIEKSRTMRVTVIVPSRKVNNHSKVVWDYNNVPQVYQCHQNWLASPCDGRESPLRQMHWQMVDWEYLIFVRWSSIKNRGQRGRRWSMEGTEIRHWKKQN